MNRTELCARDVAAASMLRTDCASAIPAVFSTISDGLATGEAVTIAEFGTFSTRSRSARHGRNPARPSPLPLRARRRTKPVHT